MNILFFHNQNGILYIRKWPPGEAGNIVDRPATEIDKNTYSHWYNQFQRNEEQLPPGIPIELLHPENAAIAALLKRNGVFTIDQCRALSGHALDQIGMGSQSWKNAAEKLYMELNKGVPLHQYQQEMADLKARVYWLEKEMDKLHGYKRGKRK